MFRAGTTFCVLLHVGLILCLLRWQLITSENLTPLYWRFQINVEEAKEIETKQWDFDTDEEDKDGLDESGESEEEEYSDWGIPWAFSGCSSLQDKDERCGERAVT